MLTTVEHIAQLQLTGVGLTSVVMNTLQARLTAALKYAGKQPVDLASACDISRAAVSKWFSGAGKNLKMEHLFRVADECRVNPRWLATGEGHMEIDKKANPYADIPQRRIDLIRMYGRLPDETRHAIRHMIEALAYITHPAKGEYERNLKKAPLMVHEE